MIYTKDSDLSLSQFLFRKGCRFRYLIATTYTVDCETLTSLASAVYDAISAQEYNLESANDSLPSLADVCLDFPEILDCAAHHIRLYTAYAPDSASYPRALYENAMSLFAVCGKVMNPSRTFHPKLLLAVFERDGKLEFHLQVGSKNLTASHALDLAVCLESERPSPAGGSCNGRQLAGFFQSYQVTLPDGVPEALQQTNFQILGGNSESMEVSDIVFAYNDNKQTLSDTLQKDIRHWPPMTPVHLFSPFMSPNSQGAFWGKALGEDVLYHTNLTETILKQGQTAPLSNLYVAKADQPFYHGKLILWQTASAEVDSVSSREAVYEDTFRIWIGSANATQNGMTRNSELMVGFRMTSRHSDTARKNRYPNFFDASFSSRHTLRARSNRCILDAGIDFTLYTRLSAPSEADCFPEDQGPLLRHLLKNLSLRACLDQDAPTLEVTIQQNAPSDTPYFVRVLLDGQTPQDLPYQKSTYRYTEKHFPPNGVYEICLLDAHKNPVLLTCVQAEAGEGVVFPAPTSLLTLLRELTARQVIPNCAVRGFSRPEDDLYQRLRAFLCSYRWDGRPDHPALEKLERRMERISQCLKSRTDTFYMADQEQKNFQELCAAVKALGDSGSLSQEVRE